MIPLWHVQWYGNIPKHMVIIRANEIAKLH